MCPASPGRPHQRVTDSSDKTACSCGTSSWPPGRIVTREPRSTGRSSTAPSVTGSSYHSPARSLAQLV